MLEGWGWTWEQAVCLSPVLGACFTARPHPWPLLSPVVSASGKGQADTGALRSVSVWAAGEPLAPHPVS